MQLAGYVPRSLVERLAGGWDADRPFAECFEAAVLFVDITGSTQLTDRFAERGPEGAELLSELLDQYFGRVTDVVEAHGGDVVQFAGDAVIAVWREPGIAAAATKAVRCALAVGRKFSGWRPANYNDDLHHRLTITAGPLTAMKIGGEDGRWYYVVAGEPISRLAEISSSAAPDEVVVSAEVWPLVAQVCVGRQRSREAYLIEGMIGSELPQYRPPLLQSELDRRTESLVGMFVPRVVADRLAADQSRWLAEFRTITMVFIRLVNVDLSADGVLEQTQAALQAIQRASRKLGIEIGNVLMDDKGVLVQVGCGLPPFAQENNAGRAVELAWLAQHAAREVRVETATGVATGRVFCGDFGSAVRRQYLSMGPIMNLAARLMQAAENEVLCDQPTAQSTGTEFAYSAPFRLALKGKDEPTTVFRLVGRRDADRRLASKTLIGRETECRRLETFVDGLRENSGAFVVIVGEPGVGKSHLLAHFTVTAEAAGARVIQAAALPIERTTAYFAFRRLLPQLLDLAGDDQEALNTRVMELVPGQGHLLAWTPLLEDILHFGITATELSQQITGQARAFAIADIVVAIASKRAAQSPLILAVDDLHWTDASSAVLLAALVRRVPGMLVVAGTRPPDADVPELDQLLGLAASEIMLGRLDRNGVAALIAQRLGVSNFPAALVDFVFTRTDGSPFYSEELILALRESGAVAVSGDRCLVALADLSAAGLPDSLQGVIVSRIDRLDPLEQLTGKVAAAIGKIFTLAALCAVHPTTNETAQLDAILQRLAQSDIVYPEADGQEPAYAFKHVIMQEVIYELLPFAQRRPLHNAIAEWLEQHHADALEPFFAQLAQHWERAQVADRAIDYLEKSAILAISQYANRDAITYIGKARRIIAQTAVVPTVPRLANWQLIEADARHELYEFAQAQDHYRHGAGLLGIAVPTTRPGLAVRTVIEIAIQLTHRMRKAKAAPSLPDDSTIARAAAHIYTRLSEHAYFASDGLRILHFTLASLNRAERAGSVREISEGYGALAIGLGVAGLHPLARFYCERALAVGASTGRLRDLSFANLFAAVYSFQAGDWVATRKYSERGAAVFAELGDRFRGQTCLIFLAHHAIAIGEYDEARRILDNLGDVTLSIENAPGQAWALSARLLLDLIEGTSPAGSLAAVERINTEDLPHAERLLCAGLMALAHLRLGQVAAALEAADQGLRALIETTPTTGILTHSISAIGEAYLQLWRERLETGGSLGDLQNKAGIACREFRAFARRTRNARPRASWVFGCYAIQSGRHGSAIRYWRRSAAVAQRLSMPLERALALDALGHHLAEGATDREACREESRSIFQRLGIGVTRVEPRSIAA